MLAVIRDGDGRFLAMRIRAAVAEERARTRECGVAKRLGSGSGVRLIDERADLHRLWLHVMSFEHHANRVGRSERRERLRNRDDFPHPERRKEEAESAVAIA